MKKLVALTGAGMSAESGFSTFRDAGGLWERYSVQDVCTPEGWERDPTMVTEFYNGLRQQLITARPNAGHVELARLEELYQVEVITQNVDDLHERAGSSHVLHLHGELMRTCSARQPDDTRYWRKLSAREPRVEPGSRCQDGALERPWIVFFGEGVPNLEAAARLVEQADVMVIIGSSLVVYPAAGLVRYVRPGVPVYLIDPKEVSVPGGREVTVIKEPASQGVATLRAMLQGC